MEKRPILGTLIALCALGTIACNDNNDPAGMPAGPVTLIAFDNAGDLFSVDPANGNATLIADTSYDPGTGAVDLDRVSAAVYVPARGEIWIGGGGNSPCPACILSLNPTTGVATLLFDNSGQIDAVPGLALRDSDGAVFTTEADGSGFFAVNPATAEATPVNASTNSGSGNGLTFDGAGTLYLAADGDLYIVDPATGVDTLVAALSLTGFPAGVNGEIVAMTTRPSDGSVYCLYKDGAGGGGSTTYLATLNTATGEVTHIAQLAMTLEGLAFVPTASLP